MHWFFFFLLWKRKPSNSVCMWLCVSTRELACAVAEVSQVDLKGKWLKKKKKDPLLFWAWREKSQKKCDWPEKRDSQAKRRLVLWALHGQQGVHRNINTQIDRSRLNVKLWWCVMPTIGREAIIPNLKWATCHFSGDVEFDWGQTGHPRQTEFGCQGRHLLLAKQICRIVKKSRI